MPRILVTTANRMPTKEDTAVLLDEAVVPAHLQDDHAAAQLVERIAWAVSDAEDVEQRPPRRVVGGQRGPARRESVGV
jgi:hypothetical protein